VTDEAFPVGGVLNLVEEVALFGLLFWAVLIEYLKSGLAVFEFETEEAINPKASKLKQMPPRLKFPHRILRVYPRILDFTGLGDSNFLFFKKSCGIIPNLRLKLMFT
jgi:hypothetical protein